MIGKTLGKHYHVLEKLGGGGFGETYLAENTQLPDKQHCVVKQFKPPQGIPPEALAQAQRSFEREAIILNDLGRDCPQIPRLLAYFAENGEFFLIQELINGHDLTQEIKEGKQLTETQAIALLDQVLDILKFVHQKNIIHRDIKPSNIMRRKKDGKLFLIDFGTVKQKIPTQMVAMGSEVESQFAFISKGYTPKEQVELRPKLASDIYALGMTAIFALTGLHPLQITEDKETGELNWRNDVNVNPKLADIIDRIVRQDYRDRYPSAVEAHQALQEFINPSPPKPKSSLVKKLLTATALLFTLGGGGYYVWQQNKTPLPLTYENLEQGIKIDYPDNWILEKVEDPFGTVAHFYPQGSQGDNNPVLVTMEVGDIDPNISLDDYNTVAIGKIIEYLPAAKIIDSRPIELNNIPAHRIVYTGQKKNSDVTTKYLQVWFKEADKVFLLTYIAPEDKYQDFSKTVEQTMIDSLVTEKVNN